MSGPAGSAGVGWPSWWALLPGTGPAGLSLARGGRQRPELPVGGNELVGADGDAQHDAAGVTQDAARDAEKFGPLRRTA